MDNHTYFFVLFYGFSFILKIYEAYQQREQEKKLIEILGRLDELRKTKYLDK